MSGEIIGHYISIAIALGLGFMIGLQREQAYVADTEKDPKGTGKQLGGVRTYPLIAATGSLAGLLSEPFGLIALVLGGLAVIVPVSLAYADDVRNERDRGITTEVAFVFTFLLGAFLSSPGVIADDRQRWLIGAAAAITITSILSVKAPLHAVVRRISQEDFFAWLKFATIALIVLPLLPDVDLGPTEELRVLNPRSIGWMIMLIAGISLIGYVLMRMLGPERGIGIIGFVGGLVSSTAVTLALAHRSRKQPSVAGACALGAVLANCIMPVRVVAIATVVHPPMLELLIVPLAAVVVTGVVAAIWLYRATRTESAPAKDLGVKNPFELGPAIKFGLLFAVVLLATRWAELKLGTQGLYYAAFLGGLTDIDAITLSVSKTGQQGEGLDSFAARAILLAVAANTLFKASLALGLGEARFRVLMGIAFGAMTGAGAVAFLLTLP